MESWCSKWPPDQTEIEVVPMHQEMAIGGEGNQVAQYKRNVKAAVVSAKHHAPSLISLIAFYQVVAFLFFFLTA